MTSPLPPADPLRPPKPPWYLRLLSLKVVIPVILLLGMILAPFLSRAWHLRAMPRVEEPFDRAELESLQIPAVDNAFTHYRRAEGLEVFPPEAVFEVREEVAREGWHLATPELEQYLAGSQPALEEFRLGAKLRQAQCCPVAESKLEAPQMVYRTIRNLKYVALMLARRHEARGEFREAWELLHDLCRVSRHAGQRNRLVFRAQGAFIFREVALHLETWSSGPSLTANDFRKAISDLQQAWELTETTSQNVQINFYDTTVNGLEQVPLGTTEVTWTDIDPQNDSRGILFYLRGEPDLAIRVQRFACQNYLKFADLPAYQRPDLDSAGYLFDDPAGLQAAGRVIPEEVYEPAFTKSQLGQWYRTPVPLTLDMIDLEAVYYPACLCLLAAQAYQRDHGQFPARLAKLVPEYLTEIPLDPYDGKPLKYRPDPEQPAIYSVFLNRVDDGGVIISFDDDLPSLGGDPPDLGLRLIAPQPGVK